MGASWVSWLGLVVGWGWGWQLQWVAGRLYSQQLLLLLLLEQLRRGW